MEKIAVISDIHGNATALEAVLADIRSRAVRRIVCLGDLVGKGPQGDRVVDLVREHCETVVMGNLDDHMTKPSGSDYVRWHQNRLGEERLRYLASLPFCTDFWMSGKFIRLLHASAESVYTRVMPWDPVEKRLSMFVHTALTPVPEDGRQPDVVGYGDIHTSLLQLLGDNMLFNPGSVGIPLDIPQASYAILEGVDGSLLPGPFSVQFVRVPYEIELAIRIAEEAGMPQLEPYKQELRTATYRGAELSKNV